MTARTAFGTFGGGSWGRGIKGQKEAEEKKRVGDLGCWESKEREERRRNERTRKEDSFLLSSVRFGNSSQKVCQETE